MKEQGHPCYLQEPPKVRRKMRSNLAATLFTVCWCTSQEISSCWCTRQIISTWTQEMRGHPHLLALLMSTFGNFYNSMIDIFTYCTSYISLMTAKYLEWLLKITTESVNGDHLLTHSEIPLIKFPTALDICSGRSNHKIQRVGHFQTVYIPKKYKCFSIKIN
jgi:hypothetical protein